jgi:AAA+ superfamily predicted ATPase
MPVPRSYEEVGRAPPKRKSPADEAPPPPPRRATLDDAGPRGYSSAQRGAGRSAAPPSPPPRPAVVFASAADKYIADEVRDGRAPPAFSSAAGGPAAGAGFQPPARTGGASGGGGANKPYQNPMGKRAGAGGNQNAGTAPGMARAIAAGNAGEEDPTCGLPPAVLARLCPNGEPVPECIRKLEPHLVQRICDEILEVPRGVSWDDIAGLEHAKAVVQEVAVWPLLAPELFRGARAVPKGILLFGPPGTGKTLIGRAIASQCRATFFGISAASLGSKWIGEGEKLVRALFAVATVLAPSVVFVDEVDALLSARKGGEGGEHEASRRLKTEFLVQMEGLDGGGEERPVLLVAATNRPADLDEAARRRLSKQIYIPLPCAAARRQLVVTLLRAGAGHGAQCAHTLQDADLDMLAERTSGYSGSDMKHLVQEAARAPLRELSRSNGGDPAQLAALRPENVRPLTLSDFRRAAKQVRPSVTADDVAFHEEWNARHGAQAAPPDADDSDGDWAD